MVALKVARTIFRRIVHIDSSYDRVYLAKAGYT